MKNDPFAFLYAGSRTPDLFSGYSPPDQFPHAEWVLVGEIPKQPEDGDGQAVRVFEKRWPATFFRIEAVAGTTSVGDPKEAYTISTGSGMGHLVASLVDAITSGMIGFKPSTTAPEGNPQ